MYSEIKSSVGGALTLVQLKVDGEGVRLAMPQASLLPLLTAAPVIDALPVASRLTVMFWQLATGFTWSSTVTVAPQVLVFPFTSVTDSTTELAPTLAQTKALEFTVMLAMPQASALPLSTAAAVMLALPALSS